MRNRVIIAVLAAALGWGLAGVGTRAPYELGAKTTTILAVSTAVATSGYEKLYEGHTDLPLDARSKITWNSALGRDCHLHMSPQRLSSARSGHRRFGGGRCCTRRLREQDDARKG